MAAISKVAVGWLLKINVTFNRETDNSDSGWLIRLATGKNKNAVEAILSYIVYLLKVIVEFLPAL